MSEYTAPSSPGDLADRLAILKLKTEKARTDEDRRAIGGFLDALRVPAYDASSAALVEALRHVNARLWELEDEVRRLMALPQTPDTVAEFVKAARAVPVLNDVRAFVKNRIDVLMGHEASDVKIYT